MKFDVNPSRTFGVELEIFFTNGLDRYEVASRLREAGVNINTEGYNHYVRHHWKIITDRSIKNSQGRNDLSCMEIVSPPLYGLDGLEEVRKVADELKAMGAKVNKSCGFHVHHDVRHYGLQEFKNLYILYTKCEPAMDSLVPLSRRGNKQYYCQSLRRRNVFDWINNVNSIRDISYKLNRNRYLKLNILSYFKYGTIEFRQHSGTIESDKIINWIVFTQAIVNTAAGVKIRVGYCNNDTAEGTMLYLRNVITADCRYKTTGCDELVQQAIKFQYKRRRQLNQRQGTRAA